jgi:hypothetical protein
MRKARACFHRTAAIWSRMPGQLSCTADAPAIQFRQKCRAESGSGRANHLASLRGGAPMSEVTTLGLDLAKTVFQVHAVDGKGRAMIRRSLRRGQSRRAWRRGVTSAVALRHGLHRKQLCDWRRRFDRSRRARPAFPGATLFWRWRKAAAVAGRRRSRSAARSCGSGRVSSRHFSVGCCAGDQLPA